MGNYAIYDNLIGERN